MKRAGFSFLLSGVIFLGAVSRGLSAAPETLPKFQEVYQLLLTNGSGFTEQELDRAAVKGLLDQLQSRVVLVTNTAPGAIVKTDLVSKVSVFDSAYPYFRIEKVEGGLKDALKSAYEKISATNKIKGVVLDLRYAEGTDYLAAAKAADLFLKTERTLLRWGETSARSTSKENAISVPVAVLVNQQTSGAAEALAGIIRETQIGLVIGTNTAGQASIFKEFPLENGQSLKVASAPVKLANGKKIPEHGLKPDIGVVVSAEDEKAAYENPYRVSVDEPTLAETETNDSASSSVLPRRRINEAELVRLQRQGLSPDEAFLDEFAKAPAPTKPVLRDLALVRSLDLLKGLAVVQQGRRK